MKKIIILFMVLIAPAIYAQQENATDEPQVRLVFNQADFEGRFAVLADKDDNYNYFVIDLTKLLTRFEKVYFLNLVYTDHELISIDSDISADQLWFKAPVKLNGNDVTCKLDDFKAEAAGKSFAMSDQEEAAWLGKYDKYNKDKE